LLGARCVRFPSSPGYDRLMCLRDPLRPLRLCVRHVRAHLSCDPAAIDRARAFRSEGLEERQDNAPGSSWHVKGVVSIRAGAQGDVSGSVPHYKN
jgi:hypothetical protein